MRAGEESAAIGEFKQAAEYMVARGDFHAAGRLMLDRAKRRELAREFFERGWREKAGANAPVCGQALLELYAEEEDPARLVAHVEEAARFYGPNGHQAHAGRFFNRLAELASRKNLTSVREDLRDKALVNLAVKLRQRAGYVSGNAVAETFGAGLCGRRHSSTTRAWPFAARAKKVRELPSRVGVQHAAPLRLGNGRVTALCFAQHTDEVFAGFETGEVVPRCARRTARCSRSRGERGRFLRRPRRRTVMRCSSCDCLKLRWNSGYLSSLASWQPSTRRSQPDVHASTRGCLRRRALPRTSGALAQRPMEISASERDSLRR